MLYEINLEALDRLEENNPDIQNILTCYEITFEKFKEYISVIKIKYPCGCTLEELLFTFGNLTLRDKLDSMAKKGLVTSRWDEEKEEFVYKITDKGKLILEENKGDSNG